MNYNSLLKKYNKILNRENYLYFVISNSSYLDEITKEYHYIYDYIGKEEVELYYWSMMRRRDDFENKIKQLDDWCKLLKIFIYSPIAEIDKEISYRTGRTEEECRKDWAKEYNQNQNKIKQLRANESIIELTNKIFDLEMSLIHDMSMINAIIKLLDISSLPQLKYIPFIDYAYFNTVNVHDWLTQEDILLKKLDELQSIVEHIQIYLDKFEIILLPFNINHYNLPKD